MRRFVSGEAVGPLPIFITHCALEQKYWGSIPGLKMDEMPLNIYKATNKLRTWLFLTSKNNFIG